MLARPGKEPHPEKGRTYRARAADHPDHVREAARRQLLRARRTAALLATPLLIALVLIELSDIVFAMDSILAIFAITPTRSSS